jgi:chromosome segregation ATPase
METVVQQLEAALAKVKTLEGDLTASAALLTESQAKITELSVKIEADAKAHVEAVAKMKADADQAAVVAKEQADKLTAGLEAASTERDEAKRKLANPAFRMASAEGDKKAVEDGGTAHSEPGLSQAQAQAEYRKLDGKPEEQKAYRVKNWRVLGIAEES